MRRLVRPRRLLPLAVAAPALALLAAGLLLRARSDDVPAVAGATPAAKRTLAPELADGAGPIAWAPSQPNIAYLVGFDRTLYKTTDAGASWQPVS